DVAIWNRTPERAAALARELGLAHVRSSPPPAADLLVNATSVGLGRVAAPGAALSALGLEGLDPPGLVVDLVYRADGGPTPVLEWARQGGSRVVDGIEVLVRQGGRSFELWTGKPAPLKTMRAAAREGP